MIFPEPAGINISGHFSPTRYGVFGLVYPHTALAQLYVEVSAVPSVAISTSASLACFSLSIIHCTFSEIKLAIFVNTVDAVLYIPSHISEKA